MEAQRNYIDDGIYQIIHQISILQKELDDLLNQENTDSEKVIAKSHELDKLIVKYYNFLKKKIF